MHAARTVIAFAMTALAVLVPRGANASPSAKLVYVREAGTEACPGEAELRAAVAARVGYDPFFPVARKTLVAQVSRRRVGASVAYRGRLQIVDGEGNVRGDRELASAGADCRELISAMALAASLALDDADEPSAAPPDPAPTPPSDEASASPVSAVAPAAPPPPSPEVAAPPMEARARWSLAGSLGPTLSIGTAPDAALGAGVALALRRASVSVRLDVRGELPAGKAIAGGGRVATNLGLATGSLCVALGATFGCAGGGAGVLWSRTSGIAHPASDHAAIGVAVLRLGGDVSLGPRLYLEPSFELGANLTPKRVEVDGQVVDETSPVWGTVALAIGATFF